MNPQIRSAMDAFLGKKNIAIVGHTWKADDAASHVIQKLRALGYTVFAVGAGRPAVKSETMYRSLRSIPEKIDAVLVTGDQHLSARTVDECSELGIHLIWLHSALGTSQRGWMRRAEHAISSVGSDAIQMALEKGITLIPGGCPMMFCKQADFPHRAMRALLDRMGCFEDCC